MNIRQHKFVTEYLRFGDQSIAYKNAYNSTATGKVIESAANRLMKHPEVAQAIADAQATIREQVEKKVTEQLKGELLTMQKKRELLYQIATGQMHVLQYHKGKDCNTCTQYVTPTINQMLRAIHLDNKLAGHYPYQQKQQKRKNSPPELGAPVPLWREDIGGNAKGIEDNGGGPLAQEKRPENHNKTQQLSSSCPSKNGEPDSASCDNQKKLTRKNHNKTQQFPSSCHAELDSASHEINKNTGLTYMRKSMKNHNIPIAIGTQQTHREKTHPNPSVGGEMQELSPAGGGDQRSGVEPLAKGDLCKKITQQELNNLLNTQLNHEETPRLLQFRRQKQLTE